jgi:hypothetical protein
MSGKKYVCDECRERVEIPATLVIKDPDFNKRLSQLKPGQFLSRSSQATGFEPELRISCCPFCSSMRIGEA